LLPRQSTRTGPGRLSSTATTSPSQGDCRQPRRPLRGRPQRPQDADHDGPAGPCPDLDLLVWRYNGTVGGADHTQAACRRRCPQPEPWVEPSLRGQRGLDTGADADHERPGYARGRDRGRGRHSYLPGTANGRRSWARDRHKRLQRGEGERSPRRPCSLDPLWVQLVGHPAQSPSAGGQRPRQPFEELYFQGRYGTPFKRDQNLVEQLEADGMLQPPAPQPWRKDEVRALARMFGLPE
jgi:hypothetical protein